MADEPTTSSGAQPVTPPEPTAGKPAPIVFETPEAYQAALETALKERLERKERQAAEREQRARAEAEAKALAEQGKFKELYEQAQAEAARAKAEAEALRGTTLRREIAAKHGLPDILAARLTGSTPEELEADAAALLAALPKTPKPTLAPTNPGGAATNGETRAQALARLNGAGVNVFDPVEAAKLGGGVIFPDPKS